MTMRGIFWLACLTTVLTGLNAGFFYTWSFTITGSLDLIEATHAVDAMRSINANIQSGWFGLIFFGSPLTLLICTILVFASRGAKPALWWFAALALMALTIAITMQVHVPMNDALATNENTDFSALWHDYSTRWTNWNHLRTLTSTLAFTLAIIATARYRSAAVLGHNRFT